MNHFIEACQKGANKDRLGIIKVGAKEITGSGSLKSFTVEESCYVDGSIIGAIYVKCLTGEFVNLNESLLEKKIEAKVGIKGNETICHLGHYTVEKPKDEKTSSLTSIKAYDDLMDKIDEKYVCGINYEEQDETNKIHVSDLYLDVCRNLGLTPTTTEFLNSDIEVSNNPFTNGETNRTVLKAIATVACSFVVITENNQIDLSWLSDTLDYTFLKNDYSTLESNDTVLGPINTVVLKNSEIDDENVTKSAEDIEVEHAIVISEDYILKSAEIRKNAITAIFNRLNGLTYVDVKLTTYYGKPFLKIGSKIKIETDHGFLETYVLKHQFTFNGAFTSTIESPVETEQEIKTKQSTTLKEALKNTQITVDKQNSKIEAIVNQVEEQGETVVSLLLDIDGVKETVSKSNSIIDDNIEQLKEQMTTLEQTADKLSLNIDNINQSGVDKVVTSTGFVFDENGLNISKSEEPMSAVFDNTGLLVKHYDTEMLDARGDKLIVNNITSKTYLTAGKHRIEKFKDEKNRETTGFFWVGD